MTGSLHFFHTLVLSATLQIGAIVLLLGIMTVWRTARTEFFWPAVGLLSVAVVIMTHTFYRFAFSSHDLCWLNCLGSAGVLALAAGSLTVMIDRRVDVPLPGPKGLGVAVGTVGVFVIVIEASIAPFNAVPKPTPETAFLLSAAVAGVTAVFTIWLDRTVTVIPVLHWGIRGVSATAVVVTLGALSQIVSVQLITGVVTVATISIGIGIYAFHRESLVIDAAKTRG